MGVGKIILLLVLLIILLSGVYYIYRTPAIVEKFNIQQYNSNNFPVNASSELVQFYPNMRFPSSSLGYYIKPDCSEEEKAKLIEAMGIVKGQTGILEFYKTSAEKADIITGCSQNEYSEGDQVFVAGEGGPTKVINSSFYPLILQGKVMLYKHSSCDYPVTELHEIFHVFGFDHINNSSLIMYPYLDCKQKINPQLINSLKTLYSIKPLTELYFSNVSALKQGKYLNFSVEIINDGLVRANSVTLEILSGSRVLRSEDLENIDIGSGTSFQIGNLPIDSNIREIGFLIKVAQEEYSKTNNEVKLNIV